MTMRRSPFFASLCAILLMAGCQSKRVLTPDDIVPSAGLPVQPEPRAIPQTVADEPAPYTITTVEPQAAPAPIAAVPIEVTSPSEPLYVPIPGEIPEPVEFVEYDPAPLPVEAALTEDAIAYEAIPVETVAGPAYVEEATVFEASSAPIGPVDAPLPAAPAASEVIAPSAAPVPEFTPIPQPGLSTYGSAF